MLQAHFRSEVKNKVKKLLFTPQRICTRSVWKNCYLRLNVSVRAVFEKIVIYASTYLYAQCLKKLLFTPQRICTRSVWKNCYLRLNVSVRVVFETLYEILITVWKGQPWSWWRVTECGFYRLHSWLSRSGCFVPFSPTIYFLDQKPVKLLVCVIN